MESNQSRRSLIKNLALGASAIIAAPAISFAAENKSQKKIKLKGNINHSVSRWTFNYLSLDELCKAVKEIGFSAIDLVGPHDWWTLQHNVCYRPYCYQWGEKNLKNVLTPPIYNKKL